MKTTRSNRKKSKRVIMFNNHNNLWEVWEESSVIAHSTYQATCMIMYPDAMVKEEENQV